MQETPVSAAPPDLKYRTENIGLQRRLGSYRALLYSCAFFACLSVSYNIALRADVAATKAQNVVLQDQVSALESGDESPPGEDVTFVEDTVFIPHVGFCMRGFVLPAPHAGCLTAIAWAPTDSFQDEKILDLNPQIWSMSTMQRDETLLAAMSP